MELLGSPFEIKAGLRHRPLCFDKPLASYKLLKKIRGEQLAKASVVLCLSERSPTSCSARKTYLSSLPCMVCFCNPLANHEQKAGGF